MSCLRSPRRWAVSAFSRKLCCLAAGLALFSAGCGKGPKAEFVVRDSTNELVPSAQKAVKKTLDDKFGNPQELVAWARFPVNYGGVKGAVAEVTKDGIVATWEGETKGIENGAPVLWISGPRSDAKVSAESVAKYDAATNKLTISGPAEPAPAAGDKFVIGFGHLLQTGRVVYMKNCMHCHGVSGDGAGPTAQYLNPLPRDYRSGVFKFKSTLNPERPTRDDLHRVIMQGIPGTYMPSFRWLGEKETESAVEYVRWLAMRGEFEIKLDNDLGNDYSQKGIEDAFKKADEAYRTAKGSDKPAKPKSIRESVKAAEDEFKKYEKEDFPQVIEDSATVLAQSWIHAEDAESLVTPSVPRVTDDAASRERGRRIYLSDKGKCYTCHGVQGRGDGASTEEYWKAASGEYYKVRGLHDDWGHPLKPRNLTLGQYRGGRRPVDVFRRVYAGIRGGPMPAFGRTALKDEEIWDVVNYVMSLQYQSTTPAKTVAAEHATASK